MAGLCDILIATKDAVMGMAGPALVEAALGRAYTAAEIGPVDVHVRAGVIDILCEDDAEAVAHAQMCLGFFQGAEPVRAVRPTAGCCATSCRPIRMSATTSAG